jgi:hypothetical protein
MEKYRFSSQNQTKIITRVTIILTQLNHDQEWIYNFAQQPTKLNLYTDLWAIPLNPYF